MGQVGRQMGHGIPLCPYLKHATAVHWDIFGTLFTVAKFILCYPVELDAT